MKFFTTNKQSALASHVIHSKRTEKRLPYQLLLLCRQWFALCLFVCLLMRATEVSLFHRLLAWQLAPQFFTTMKDVKGIERGSCNSQDCDCKEFMVEKSTQIRCAYCDCPPSKHHDLGHDVREDPGGQNDKMVSFVLHTCR